ncbi:MAG: hypothetical protein L6R41_005122 [Letrouitia leprolyta]|nr:MAG: hypothetical protein L6R41_005122 [Letrouitia leprolyta]
MAPKDIESLLPRLLSFPLHPPPPVPLSDAVYDKEIKSLRKTLNDTPANLLTSGVPNGGDLLDILDPSINTLPSLYVLLAHIVAARQKASVVGGPLWFKALDFCERFDAVQVRYVGTEFRRLVVYVRDVALASGQPAAAVRPIRSAILRLDPSGSCFTSTHLLFVHLCLQACCFRAARPVLDRDIYEFPGPSKLQPPGYPCSQHDTSAGYITDQSDLSAALTYRDPLLYFLHGAMIYMAMKEWNRAIPFLEVILTARTRNHASRIQVEAYKKWVLVNLLADGQVPGSLPKTTTSQVAKQVRTLGKPYEALGEIFKDGQSKELDARRLNAEIHAGNQKWSEDYNLSLVLQVLDAYRQFTIVKLGTTYAALPLPLITQRTSSNPNDHMETAQYISMMISNGRLNATLDQRTQDPQSWVLRFASSPSTGPHARSEQENYEELVAQAARNAELANHVRETDRKLTLSKEYLNWLRQSKKDTGNAGNEGDEAPTLPGQHDDEDIMGDG